MFGSYWSPWRRRRLGRAVRTAVVFVAAHPRLVAVPAVPAVALAAGTALRAAVPAVVVAVLVALAAVPVAVAMWQAGRAGLPRWRRRARFAVLAGAAVTVVGGWWWAAALLAATVAVAVLDVPTLIAVVHPDDEPRPMPTWTRPGLRKPVRARLRARRSGSPTVTRVATARPRPADLDRSTRAAAGETVPETAWTVAPLPRSVEPETVETAPVRPSETVVAAPPAVDPAEQVRALLAAAEGPVAPVQLYRTLGVSRATMHRWAAGWCAAGWLDRVEGGYQLHTAITSPDSAPRPSHLDEGQDGRERT